MWLSWNINTFCVISAEYSLSTCLNETLVGGAATVSWGCGYLKEFQQDWTLQQTQSGAVSVYVCPLSLHHADHLWYAAAPRLRMSCLGRDKKTPAHMMVKDSQLCSFSGEANTQFDLEQTHCEPNLLWFVVFLCYEYDGCCCCCSCKGK